MKNSIADSREFIRGAARAHDLVYILTKGKTLMEQDISHTSAIAIDQDQWCDAVNTDWDSTAIAVARKPSEKLVFIGEDGDVCTYVGGKSTKELIKPAPKLIRNARTVDGLVIACGMLRQVFKRVGEKQWLDISAPFPKAEEEVGFEAIDGYSLDEIYAVGWNGEIWEHDGSKWSDRSSPTNVILSSICCGPDGLVYTGGQEGVMIRGRHSSWKAIQWKDDVDVDIWDLCWFNNKLYVATSSTLFTLDEDQLTEVDFGELETPSCFNLTETGGVMWSIGHADVLSFDGNRWRAYE